MASSLHIWQAQVCSAPLQQRVPCNVFSKALMVPLLAEIPQLICHALQDLIRELLPSPQRCLEEIHALLPQLAAQRYQELVEEVSPLRSIVLPC